MSNENFTFQRFWNYFQYDLKQLWRNNGKAAILLGFISVICYLVWVVGSLVFTGQWHAPAMAARLVFFFFGSLILMFYQTRTYGYLTEKQAGSAWLMIPASVLEKSISMILITILVIPLAYVGSYLILDSVIALLDPTAGDSLIKAFVPAVGDISNALSAASEEGFQFNLAALAVPFVLQLVADFLYFLLCGICFKKWKIAGGLGVLLGLSVIFTPLITYLSIHVWAPMLSAYGGGDDPTLIEHFTNAALNWGTLANWVIVIGLALGIYYRIKTLKH